MIDKLFETYKYIYGIVG